MTDEILTPTKSKPQSNAHDVHGLSKALGVRVTGRASLKKRLAELGVGSAPLPNANYDLRWLLVLSESLQHEPFLIEAFDASGPVGSLPLGFVSSRLFGRYLVSMPYLTSGGVQTSNPQAATALIDRAVRLADDLDCRFLELRHETPHKHPALTEKYTDKVIMRLDLPETEEQLWKGFQARLRTAIRKGGKQGFTEHWGRHDLLDDFYAVYCRNMRDLGTPVHHRKLFECILDYFPDDTELCSIRDGDRPVAVAMLVHGNGTTEIPSVAALRSYRPTYVNSYLNWKLVQRAFERNQRVLDFGRSTYGSGTYAFKKKWGAKPHPTTWQTYLRRGESGAMRRDNEKYDRLIRIWQRLPVGLTRLVGPMINRGIP